jgi:hypothetical protein
VLRKYIQLLINSKEIDSKQIDSKEIDSKQNAKQIVMYGVLGVEKL